MHVVVNGWYYRRLDVGSGQYLQRLLAHLPAQTPHHFTVLVPAEGPNRPPKARIEPAPSHTIWPHTLPAWPKSIGKVWWEQMLVPQIAQRLDADVVWVPYWAAPVWQPCPVVVTVHDLIPVLLPAYRGGILNRLYTWMVCQTARQAAAIITVSHASRRDIIRHLRVPAENVHVVYNGLDEDGGTPSQAQQDNVRERLSLPNRYFLYLGGFDVRKNVTATLSGYRRYLDRGGDPAIRMVIAGKVPAVDDLHPDPRHIVRELCLHDQVDFCGYVEEADKPALCAMATGFLFPSLYEGFGLPVVEAMAAGTPVITSDR